MRGKVDIIYSINLIWVNIKSQTLKMNNNTCLTNISMLIETVFLLIYTVESENFLIIWPFKDVNSYISQKTIDTFIMIRDVILSLTIIYNLYAYHSSHGARQVTHLVHRTYIFSFISILSVYIVYMEHVIPIQERA